MADSGVIDGGLGLTFIYLCGWTYFFIYGVVTGCEYERSEPQGEE